MNDQPWEKTPIYGSLEKFPCDCQPLQFHGHFLTADKTSNLFEDRIHKTANHCSSMEGSDMKKIVCFRDPTVDLISFS